jgi:putative phosphoribosyl transferase
MRNDSPSPVDRHVEIGSRRLEGTLSVPPQAKGLVIFAHGSGSSRLSPRNTRVAREFNERGFATLLFDLLTGREAANRANVFDIALLGARVAEAIKWARRDAGISGLRIGLFGASTGAAAALVAAASSRGDVAAIVSRGGRPDLAGKLLPRVHAPTLLIVGGADIGVIDLNEQALSQLACEKRLEIVAGATHLFEERGALHEVVELASRWFERHLGTLIDSGRVGP